MRQRIRVIASVMVVALLAAACTQQRVNEAEIGVHYTDGPIEGRHFEDVLEPGDAIWVWNDSVYKLPARQITWITGPGEEADAPSLVFTAKGGERMVMELSTRFFLNTTMDEDKEPFKSFFNELCDKYDCWDGALDGTDPSDGWNRMLRDTVGNPQQAAANALGLEYDADKLRYDNATREAFADAFADEFERLMAEEVDVSNIFCGPGYERGNTSCPAISVKVTNVQFDNGEREGIREQQRLAEEQEALAVEQEAAARAQQRVNEAKATPEFERLAQAEAMKACAANPECTLVINVGGDDIAATVPTG